MRERERRRERERYRERERDRERERQRERERLTERGRRPTLHTNHGLQTPVDMGDNFVITCPKSNQRTNEPVAIS